MKKWAVPNPAMPEFVFPRDPRLEPYLVRAGFWGWTLVEGIVCDWAQLTALVERWRPETHTFHLRDGEMTLLLEDVGLLTGLPIEGLAVTGTDDSSDDWEELCIRCFGRDLPRHNKRRTCVKKTVLYELFHEIPADADRETLERHVRAYLLVMVGSTLFPDASGNLVSLHWLQLLEDLDAVQNYSWGSAALAFLYRSLCTASIEDAKELCGPAVILQLWAWEHMELGRPGLKYDQPLIEGALADPMRRPPYGYRWSQHKSFIQTPNHVLMFYRDHLDLQTPGDLTWQPYLGVSPQSWNPLCFTGRDSWYATCPLICFEILEWHRPERVMRQLGYGQLIPEHPPSEQKRFHKVTRKTRKVNWAIRHQTHIRAWGTRHRHRVDLGEPPMWEEREAMLVDYRRWYNTVTRRVIMPRQDDSPEEEPPLKVKGYQPEARKQATFMKIAAKTLQAAYDMFFTKKRSSLKKKAHDLFHGCLGELEDIGHGDLLGNLDSSKIDLNRNEDEDSSEETEEQDSSQEEEEHFTQPRSQLTQEGPSTSAPVSAKKAVRRTERQRKTTNRWTPGVDEPTKKKKKK